MTMESMKSSVQGSMSVEMSELSLSEVLGEQGSVLPERSLMRHRRRNKVVSFGPVVSADHGSAANGNSTIQLGNGNTNTTNQNATVINIF